MSFEGWLKTPNSSHLRLGSLTVLEAGASTIKRLAPGDGCLWRHLMVEGRGREEVRVRKKGGWDKHIHRINPFRIAEPL
jgi:hypothetical protein